MSFFFVIWKPERCKILSIPYQLFFLLLQMIFISHSCIQLTKNHLNREFYRKEWIHLSCNSISTQLYAIYLLFILHFYWYWKNSKGQLKKSHFHIMSNNDPWQRITATKHKYIYVHKNTYSLHLKGKVKDFSIRMTATFQRHTSRRVSFWKKSNNRKITDSNVEKSTNAPSDKSHTIRWNVFLPFYVLMVAGFSAVYLFITIFSSISFFSIFFFCFQFT